MVPTFRRLRRVVPLALALMLSPAFGCGGQMKAETEHASGTDFSAFKTYRWITEDLVLIQAGTGDAGVRTVENEKRIRAAVEREMQAKGLTKTAEDADLVVAFTVGTKVRYQLEGGESYNIMTTGPGKKVTRGTLTLYFFDPNENTQVWEAWTSKKLDGTSDPDTVINTAVALLLEQFPPPS